MKNFKLLTICLVIILSAGVITFFGCTKKVDYDYFVINGPTAVERYSEKVISNSE